MKVEYGRQAFIVVSDIVSLNRLSVRCGTTPKRQSGYINGFCLDSSRDL